MNNEVKYKSVREVLRKGHIYVNGIVTLLMICVWLLFYKIASDQDGVTLIFIGLLMGVFAGWLYWSLAIPKWRIWAFRSVEKGEWIKLKTRAISEGLIWPDNSFLNKTEIRTSSQKQEIKDIEDEFPNEEYEISLDEIQDDESIPSKTEYYFARSELILNPILLVACIGGGIYLYINNSVVIAAIAVIVGIYNFRLELFKNLFNRKKQMTISNEGIEMNLKGFEFVNWSDTRNIVFDEDKGILRLDAIKDDELYHLTYNVGSLGMKSREDMIRRINIYLKRSQMRSGS